MFSMGPLPTDPSVSALSGPSRQLPSPNPLCRNGSRRPGFRHNNNYVNHSAVRDGMAPHRRVCAIAHRMRFRPISRHVSPYLPLTSYRSLAASLVPRAARLSPVPAAPCPLALPLSLLRSPWRWQCSGYPVSQVLSRCVLSVVLEQVVHVVPGEECCPFPPCVLLPSVVASLSGEAVELGVGHAALWCGHLSSVRTPSL